MEKHIQKKVNTYCIDYRNAFFSQLDSLTEKIKEKVSTEQYNSVCYELNEIKMKCTFVPLPEIKKNEFKKQKRIHNVVPDNEKCLALCSKGVRCSRRKQVGCNYCGTHIKGQPNGSINSKSDGSISVPNQQKEVKNTVKIVYPRNENGIVKLYADEECLVPVNANDFMNHYVKCTN